MLHPDAYERPVSFRHSGWARTRDRIRIGLAALGGRTSRLERWDSCGSNPWLVRSQTNPDLYRIHVDHCHDRFCKPCAGAKARLIAGNLVEKMSDRRHKKLVLTLYSEQEPLADLIKLLYDSFKALRRTDLWRQSIHGGACFLEVKYNRALDRWHPHLHVICQGHWIEQGWLSQAWHRITGKSYICHISRVKDKHKAADYAAKYASKGISGSYVNDDNRLGEAITALTGRRVCMTFGDWRGWKLLRVTSDGPWQYLARLPNAVTLATHGDAFCLDLLRKVGIIVEVLETRPRLAMPRAPAECYLWKDTPWNKYRTV